MKKLTLIIVAVLVVLATAANAGDFKPVNLDGNLSEWSGVSDLYTRNGGNILTVKVVNTERFLTFYTVLTNGQSYDGTFKIYLDTDDNTGTGFNGGWMGRGYDYMVEGSTLYEFTGAAQSDWSWGNGITVFTGVNGLIRELTINRNDIGNYKTSPVYSLLSSGADYIPQWESGVTAYNYAAVPASYNKTLSLKNITFDGNLDDWAGVPSYSDPANDEVSASMDLTNYWMACSLSNLYVAMAFRGDVAFGSDTYQWFLDIDNCATTGYHHYNNAEQFDGGYDVMFQGASAFGYTGSGYDWAWAGSWPAMAAWGTNGNILEVSLPIQGTSAQLFMYMNSLSDHIPDFDAERPRVTLTPEPALFGMLVIAALAFIRRK